MQTHIKCDTLRSHANGESKVFCGLKYYCLCLRFHIWGKLRLQVEFIKFCFQHSVLPLGTEFLWNEALGSVLDQEKNIPRFLLGSVGVGSKIIFSLSKGVLLYHIKFPIFIVSKKIALAFNLSLLWFIRPVFDISIYGNWERIALLHLLLGEEDAQVREHPGSHLEEAEENRPLGFPIPLRKSHQRKQ